MVQDLRELNRSAVLTQILRSRPLSRKAIAERSGISPATVSRAVEDLIAEGLVVEGEEIVVKRRGRRARVVDLVPDRGHVVGIDLGASSTRIAALDLLARPAGAAVLATPADLSPAALGRWLSDAVRDALGSRWPGMDRVSLGLPGAVSREDRRVSNAPNLPQVESPEFVAALEDGLGQSVLLDNDANFALLGEQRMGAARHAPTAAMLTLGTGLGAAISIDGTVLRGRQGMVGEFGQLPVGPLGARLEHMVTGPGILRRAAESSIELASPADLFRPENADRMLVLRSGFDQAMLVVLTAVTVSCEPAVVVLGGRIARSLASSLPAYRRALEQNLGYAPELVLAGLGDMAGALGAAVAALREVYSAIGAQPQALAELPVVEEATLAALTSQTPEAPAGR